MTDDHRNLAGEYALGVLSGDDLRRARALLRSDAEFRAEVAYWTGRFAPLLEDVAEVRPPADVWRGVDAALPAPANSSNVVQLTRRVTVWRSVAAVMTALAASLAIVIARPELLERPAGPPMVAMLGDQQEPMKVLASWNPKGSQLVLAAAGDMPADPAHAHELWVIPADGKPRSLGTMPGAKMHMKLADALAQLMREGATIAITVEPLGGSPTGDPTGPMVASGKLQNT